MNVLTEEITPPIPQPETGPWYNSFAEVATQSMDAWRKLKSPRYKDLSQSVDIPKRISERMLSVIVNNLPSYIPREIVERIRETHPEPLIGVSVAMVDSRISKENSIAEPEFDDYVDIAEGDREIFFKGVELLNEIATDTLANDIFREISKRKEVSEMKPRNALDMLRKRTRILSGEDWFRPMAKIIARTDSKHNYKKGVKMATDLLGGKEHFESFRQQLVIAMLSGNHDILNQKIREYGIESLEKLAIELGGRTFYTDTLERRLLRPIIEEVNKVWPHSTAAGLYKGDFPGVIQLAAESTTIPSATAAGIYAFDQLILTDRPTLVGVGLLGLTAFHAYASIASLPRLPHTLVHEMVHYMSADLTHQGLFRTKGFKKR